MFNDKENRKRGFIKLGTIIFIVLILIILRIKWNIDIVELAGYALEKGTDGAKLLFEVLGDLFLLIKDKFTGLFQ